ncbi:MAG: SDR family oxidoreductase [Bacteroidia bacterium]|nr:SDR family oxidoreductase [Bacteroidia bacterium]MDW8334908.1 SDR family oxidoreductase [Bacteroidia bacterium]
MSAPRTVAVTGATSGIGAAIAQLYAENGWNVAACGRNLQALTPLVQRCAHVLPVACDVTRYDDCQNFIERTVERFGRLDVLINNAGISMRANFANADLDVLRKLMDVNFWGTVYCTKAALRHLKSTRGTVVGISSIAGFQALPGRTGYCASKFAMHGFLETLRLETKADGIKVLIVAPGYTQSAIRERALNERGLPQGESPRDEKKMTSARTVAEAVFRAVEKNRRTLVLTAEGKAVVALKKFFPSLADKLVVREIEKEK